MSARRTRRPLRCPLRLQALEGRIAPATFTVINNNNSGSGSLRQAVLNANAHSGADLIDFSSYFNVPRTITLASEISITGAVTIDGPSAANVTISGNNAVRIFDTQSAPAGSSIEFIDVTLKSGRIANNSSDYGGAVRAGDEILGLTRCVFAANTAYDGGAISATGGGSVTLTDCSFTSNTALFAGGAIFVGGGGSLTATNCVFTANLATSGGAIWVTDGGALTGTDCILASNRADYGGAILTGGVGSSTVLTRCAISGNSAFIGGGLSIYGNLFLDSSTVSGNVATGVSGSYGYYPGTGGGINVSGSAVGIQNSTISGNSAGTGGGVVSNGPLTIRNSTIVGNAAIYQGVGGIQGGTIAIESSIVADNTSVWGPTDIIAGTVNATTSSIRSHAGIGTFHDLGGNRPEGENPRLGTLQDNGGATQTHLLLPGSPCLNVGSNPANLTTDQRGPGFPRVLDGAIDMGAVEGVDVNPTVTLVSLPPTITVPGVTNFSVVVRYDDDIGIDLTTIDLNDIRVTGPAYATPQAPTALSISGSGTVVTVTYTFSAPGGSFDFSDDGLYTVAMVANQVGDVDTPVHHEVTAGPIGAFRVSIPGTLLVDEPSDIDDGNITAGHLSLREAVRLTNAAVGSADTITFDPAVFGTPRTITLTAGQLAITDPLLIIGPGSGRLTNAAGGGRHFNINVPGTGDLASLSGLTLINGLVNGGYGGAIAANGELTLSDVVISNCQAYDGGGAISARSLTMRDCTVSNNRALGVGGAIVASTLTGDVVLERCSFVNNQAGATGGGLYLVVNGLLQISQCTISGNQAKTAVQSSGFGCGGAFLHGSLTSGSAIRNSTISGNAAGPGGTGGGLVLYFYGTLAIANSTITGNTAAGGGGVTVSNGYYGGFGNLTLNSTIVAGNSAGTGADLYYNATFLINVPGDNNLIGVANSGNFALTGNGNQTGTLAAPLDAMLGPLANNGGPTKTHALLPGSPAINAGNNALNLPNDQRGAGFTRVVGAAADIGAFEVQAVPPTAIVRINDGSAQRSRITSLTVTFSTQVTFAGAVANAFTLSRNGGGAVNFSATASVVGGVTVVTLNNFTGSETQFASLKDGRYTLTALASQISAGGLTLDGDGDGLPGGNLTFGDTQGLFRFFGDINGDRHVDIADFGLFSGAFNLHAGEPGFLWYLDFNGDGAIDIADFGQFSLRFFTMLP